MAPFEVLVDSIRDGVLVGTNCGAADIPLGTTFTAARHVRPGMGVSPEPVGGALILTLTGVRWFNREIAVVPGGHSAELVVSGSGLDWVASALHGLPRGEYIILVAGGSADAEPSAAADGGGM
jgi:hypothetical protein